jgi:hypothetical protein
MRGEMEPEPRKAQLAGASSDSERTISVPAEVPGVRLTRCLTPSPAATRVSFVVSLAAGSPARRTWGQPSASARFRAGPSSDCRADRTCRAFLDHPLPTTKERVVGKRYMRGAGTSRPGPESRSGKAGHPCSGLNQPNRSNPGNEEDRDGVVQPVNVAANSSGPER